MITIKEVREVLEEFSPINKNGSEKELISKVTKSNHKRKRIIKIIIACLI